MGRSEEEGEGAHACMHVCVCVLSACISKRPAVRVLGGWSLAMACVGVAGRQAGCGDIQHRAYHAEMSTLNAAALLNV